MKLPEERASMTANSEDADRLDELEASVDAFFVLVSGFLVFFMQCGFMLVTIQTLLTPEALDFLVVCRSIETEERGQHHGADIAGCMLWLFGMVSLRPCNCKRDVRTRDHRHGRVCFARHVHN